MNIQPIILAAGKGTRMNNPEMPKVLSPLKGRPIISYLLDVVHEDGYMPPVIVVGYHQEKVREAFGSEMRYVVQEEQLGTGHAIRICQPVLEGSADAYLIMNGDHPLWTDATMKRLVKKHQETNATMSLVTLVTDHEAFHNFGRIIRNEAGKIEAIREYKDCTDEEKAIQEVNPALYCINDDWLWEALKKIDTANSQKEYYITDLLEIAREEGRMISSVKAETWQETLGINTPEQLEEVEKWL